MLSHLLSNSGSSKSSGPMNTAFSKSDLASVIGNENLQSSRLGLPKISDFAESMDVSRLSPEQLAALALYYSGPFAEAHSASHAPASAHVAQGNSKSEADFGEAFGRGLPSDPGKPSPRPLGIAPDEPLTQPAPETSTAPATLLVPSAAGLLSGLNLMHPAASGLSPSSELRWSGSFRDTLFADTHIHKTLTPLSHRSTGSVANGICPGPLKITTFQQYHPCHRVVSTTKRN
ncbi:unnamed protein product [Protopolystoma xenopodis]|uniref:Uncharacterized protein n=1 Tax=Protopolystoma xenopodis TaxID=117903 RepID=A0A3S5FEK3_9PLAT|nr:unnamed protein product [Protopolystoma xenopodis]